MYSFPDLEPVHCSISSSYRCFLTCIQIFRRQVRWSGIPISWRIFQFVVIHTVKGFGIVNKADDVFLELFCFLYDPMDVSNLISGSSTFSKSSLNIWKFSVHVLLEPCLEKFEHYFDSVWDECNCAVWTFFGIAFLWDWNENGSFLVPWPLLSFPNLLAYKCSTFIASSFRIWNNSTGIPSPPLALFIVMLLRPTWLHTPRCLALVEWSHHCGYLGH